MCRIVGDHDKTIMRDMPLYMQHRGSDALRAHYKPHPQDENSMWGLLSYVYKLVRTA